ncbi:hypothetical protein HPHPP30_1552 [Helicobacter pylori Hp P-30]|nr:hypothetical protein HPHPP30_1552 [Helicobacter pylori Hp P-30]
MGIGKKKKDQTPKKKNLKKDFKKALKRNPLKKEGLKKRV